MNNQKGSVSVLTLFMIPVILVIGVMVIDIGQTFITKTTVKHKLNLALRASVGIDQLCMTALRDAHEPKIVIKEDLAKRKFLEVLKANLRLDDSLNPLPGSIINGQVEVVKFKVVNNPPYTFTLGNYTETLNETGVIGIIRFPYENSFLARFAGIDSIPMTVNVSVTPRLISKHLEDWKN